MTEIDKVKEELKELYPQYNGFIEHTLVARMCLEYHKKQLSLGVVSSEFKAKERTDFENWINRNCGAPRNTDIGHNYKGQDFTTKQLKIIYDNETKP